jgi:hypothetical protein
MYLEMYFSEYTFLLIAYTKVHMLTLTFLVNYYMVLGNIYGCSN